MITLFNLDEFKKQVRENPNQSYICFAIGTSLISRIIAAKTREDDKEVVPSHAFMVIPCKHSLTSTDMRTMVYESTSQDDKIGKKIIHGGVRRWLFEDWAKCERGKETLYATAPIFKVDVGQLEGNLHRPYGIDSIVQFLVKDASKGSKKGLICSEYANLVTHIIPNNPCPSPADLFREVKDFLL